jgi:hypothetical protein
MVVIYRAGWLHHFLWFGLAVSGSNRRHRRVGYDEANLLARSTPYAVVAIDRRYHRTLKQCNAGRPQTFLKVLVIVRNRGGRLHKRLDVSECLQCVVWRVALP